MTAGFGTLVELGQFCARMLAETLASAAHVGSGPLSALTTMTDWLGEGDLHKLAEGIAVPDSIQRLGSRRHSQQLQLLGRVSLSRAPLDA